MGAALIAAGYKEMFAIGNTLECVFNGCGGCSFCGIGFGPDKYKVVVHEGNSFCLKAVDNACETGFYKFVFCFFGVNENYVGVAVFSSIDCGARACRRDFPFVSRVILFEFFVEILHETAVIYRRGGRNANGCPFVVCTCSTFRRSLSLVFFLVDESEKACTIFCFTVFGN